MFNINNYYKNNHRYKNNNRYQYLYLFKCLYNKKLKKGYINIYHFINLMAT